MQRVHASVCSYTWYPACCLDLLNREPVLCCAAPDADMRREMQSLTLEALFEAIFRVLKHSTASGAVMDSAVGALPVWTASHYGS